MTAPQQMFLDETHHAAYVVEYNETACQVVARDRADCLDNRYVALLYRYVLYRGEK